MLNELRERDAASAVCYKGRSDRLGRREKILCTDRPLLHFIHFVRENGHRELVRIWCEENIDKHYKK